MGRLLWLQAVQRQALSSGGIRRRGEILVVLPVQAALLRDCDQRCRWGRDARAPAPSYRLVCVYLLVRALCNNGLDGVRFVIACIGFDDGPEVRQY